MSENLSHESYRDDEPVGSASNRGFGCTVGGVLIVIAAARLLVLGSLTTATLVMFVGGALLLWFGIAAPARISRLNRLWQYVGTILSQVVNPIVLALLFFFVITPIAYIMRRTGKQTLPLAPDPSATTYWIPREPQSGAAAASSMQRQF
jgi:hypothetical protein